MNTTLQILEFLGLIILVYAGSFALAAYSVRHDKSNKTAAIIGSVWAVVAAVFAWLLIHFTR